MPIEVLVAIIGGASAILGSFIGVVGGQNLVKYRIDKIEAELETITNFGNRIIALEIKLDEMHKDILKLERDIEK